MLPSSLLNLLAVCLLSLKTPSVTALSPVRTPAQALELLSRQNNQCATGSSPCNKAGLPANFCCPSNQQCIAFNNNKSALCCPSGQDCKTIAPVSCDLAKQDVSKSPGGGLHTTDLTGTLAKCGSNCCPRGYSCENSNCVVQSSSTSSKTSSTASHTSTSSATASTTSKPKSTSASASSTASAIPGSADAKPQCSKIPAAAVAIGLIAGIMIGVLLTITVICLIGRHRKRRDLPEKSSASTYCSTGQPPSISDPMPHYQQNGELRNDFLRRDPNLANANTGYGRDRASSRVRSLFQRSPTFRNPQNGYGDQRSPTDGIGRTLQSPMQSPLRNGLRREPSTESIKIYSPQNDGLGRDRDTTVPQRPGTTFSGMIREADLPPNLTFLNSPRGLDPRR